MKSRKHKTTKLIGLMHRRTYRRYNNNEAGLTSFYAVRIRICAARLSHFNDFVKRGGFTLLESLVSITILMIAVTAAMSLSARSISTVSLTRNRMIATMLAQESMELIRNRRDENFIAIISDPSTNIEWLDGLLTSSSNPCTASACVTKLRPNKLDFFKTKRCPDITCSNANIKERISGPLYRHPYIGGDAVNPTIFRRYVEITDINSNIEAKVTVTVQWNDRLNRSRQVILEDRLFNWIPK